MLSAACASRPSTSPQDGQTCVRTRTRLGTRSPHPEHSWLVYWAGIASRTGAGCRGGEDGAEPRPAGIRDARGQAAVPHPVSDPHIVEVDGIVLAHQQQHRLVVAVPPLPLHVLVLPGA
jgi:hypothetical protein